jgi:hypothetical protein
VGHDSTPLRSLHTSYFLLLGRERRTGPIATWHRKISRAPKCAETSEPGRRRIGVVAEGPGSSARPGMIDSLVPKRDGMDRAAIRPDATRPACRENLPNWLPDSAWRLTTCYHCNIFDKCRPGTRYRFTNRPDLRKMTCPRTTCLVRSDRGLLDLSRVRHHFRFKAGSGSTGFEGFAYGRSAG